MRRAARVGRSFGMTGGEFLAWVGLCLSLASLLLWAWSVSS